MNLITLFPPERNAQEVTFRWRVVPETSLYRTSQFTLRFPDELDLTSVPDGIWNTIALICLHSHWTLLRPCRIRLPFKLSEAEISTWLRLLDSYVTTLEAYRGTFHLGDIVIQADGPAQNYLPLAPTARCATSFSGGKDSLLQAGLLTELTERPVLVATTSPMPPLEDHLTPRRAQIFSELSRRRAVQLIEVRSDYRNNLNHAFASKLGYPLSVNEMTDTFLYLSSLLAVGYALGVPHLFQASEIQVNENTEWHRRIVQHPHFMYSVVTLGALSALVRPWGMTISSMTCPLHSFQVQELLWTRYADLRDLQYSCWCVKGSDSICNACSQCLRIALSALALDDDPGLIGVDLVKLLNATGDWWPVRPDGTEILLPRSVSSQQLSEHVARAIQAVPDQTMMESAARTSPGQLATPQGQSALAAWRRLQQWASGYQAGPAPGYRPRFETFLAPTLRQKILAICQEHFAPAAEEEYADMFSRCERLTRWIVEPLSRERQA